MILTLSNNSNNKIMAKRASVQAHSSRSKKTKKRLAIKYAMLAAKKKR
ncbi:MAG: hypothetical protein WCW03_01910 [Candidatus Paceibacterota bacterium]|jgi:hypothetical protein